MRLSNLPPGVSVFDEHINPTDEPQSWRTRRTWILDACPSLYGDPDYRTLLDAVYIAHLPLPVSHDDLTGTCLALALLGIKHNLVGGRAWWIAMLEAEAVRPPYPWCIGNPTIADCCQAGYCPRNPNCGE